MFPAYAGMIRSLTDGQVFPAYAGMIRHEVFQPVVSDRVPRLRGDDPLNISGEVRRGFGKRTFVFPAYAGMIRRECGGRRQRGRVPRLRGDDPSLAESAATAADQKCSPPTRG